MDIDDYIQHPTYQIQIASTKIWSGTDKNEARRKYENTVRLSRSDVDPQGPQIVRLLRDDDVEEQYVPPLLLAAQNPEPVNGTLEALLGVAPDGATDERTLFYPGAGHDWEGLVRLTHLYDRFVFCDLGIQNTDVSDILREDRLNTLLAEGNRLELDQDRLPWLFDIFERIEVPEERKRRYLRCRDDFIRGADWGFQIRLIRKMRNRERKVTLYCLRTEGVATFIKLFASRNSSPGGICIQPYFQDLELQGEDGLLAQALRTTPRRPRLLFGDTRWDAQPDPWQQYGAWRNMRAVLSAPEPCPEDRTFEFARRISLHYHARPDQEWPLTEVDAVIASRNALGNRPLPDSVEYISYSRIGANRPMHECLQQLEAICRDKGISRVATLPFGLEDEGIVLRDWAMAEGLPREVHFHCATPGDMHSLDLDAAASLVGADESETTGDAAR